MYKRFKKPTDHPNTTDLILISAYHSSLSYPKHSCGNLLMAVIKICVKILQSDSFMGRSTNGVMRKVNQIWWKWQKEVNTVPWQTFVFLHFEPSANEWKLFRSRKGIASYQSTYSERQKTLASCEKSGVYETSSSPLLRLRIILLLRMNCRRRRRRRFHCRYRTMPNNNK